MKVCPVCNAVAFEDAAVCYGCLHQFGESDLETTYETEKGAFQAEAVVELEPSSEAGVCAPGFLIRFTPSVDDEGAVTWSCAIEA